MWSSDHLPSFLLLLLLLAVLAVLLQCTPGVLLSVVLPTMKRRRGLGGGWGTGAVIGFSFHVFPSFFFPLPESARLFFLFFFGIGGPQGIAAVAPLSESVNRGRILSMGVNKVSIALGTHTGRAQALVEEESSDSDPTPFFFKTINVFVSLSKSLLSCCCWWWWWWLAGCLDVVE